MFPFLSFASTFQGATPSPLRLIFGQASLQRSPLFCILFSFSTFRKIPLLSSVWIAQTVPEDLAAVSGGTFTYVASLAFPTPPTYLPSVFCFSEPPFTRSRNSPKPLASFPFFSVSSCFSLNPPFVILLCLSCYKISAETRFLRIAIRARLSEPRHQFPWPVAIVFSPSLSSLLLFPLPPIYRPEP